MAHLQATALREAIRASARAEWHEREANRRCGGPGEAQAAMEIAPCDGAAWSLASLNSRRTDVPLSVGGDSRAMNRQKQSVTRIAASSPNL